MSTSTTEPGAGVYRTHPGHSAGVSAYPRLGNGAVCFHPGDDSPDTGTCCFHPGHSAGVSAYPRLGNGAVCFHPATTRLTRARAASTPPTTWRPTCTSH